MSDYCEKSLGMGLSSGECTADIEQSSTYGLQYFVSRVSWGYEKIKIRNVSLTQPRFLNGNFKESNKSRGHIIRRPHQTSIFQAS
jgi:hypothetical protein